MPIPTPNSILKKSDLDDESLSLLNQILANFSTQINNLRGVNGKIALHSDLDLNGNKITNVGAAESESDVVTQAFASRNYGPAALAPAFNALGKQTLQTYRQLSNPNQREKSSSFLNALVSTPPSANTSIVTFGAPGGGTVTATVTAGFHQRVDDTQTPYASRTDTLSLPTSFAITNLTRSGNIVTYSGANTGFTVGDSFTVTGSSDPTFDGTFAVLTGGGSSFTYYQSGPDDGPKSGGNVSTGGIYYYTLAYGNQALELVTGAGAADTTSNRTAASIDGNTIIAVAILNSAGGDLLNSAAGATPQQSGSTVAVIRRL